MKHKFQTAIDDLHKIRMSAEEKRAMRARITGASGAVKSPYLFTFWFSSHRVFSAAAAAVCLILLVSGSLAYAAGGALPGDTLYALKVQIVEPLRVTLAGGAASRARVQSELATLRLSEAETLAARGKLDQPREREITALLKVRAAALAQSLVQVKKSAPVEADDIVVGFQAAMDAHADVLDTIAAAATPVPARAAVQVRATSTEVLVAEAARDSAFAVVQTDDGLDSETHASAAATPPAAAMPHLHGAGRRAASVVPPPEPSFSAATSSSPSVHLKNESRTGAPLSEKKQVIRALIMQASTTIQNVGTDTSPAEETIINQTRQTLNEASQSLDQAEEEQSGGNSQNAYDSLLQSEKSAREANIFINASLEFHGKHGGSHGRGNADDPVTGE